MNLFESLSEAPVHLNEEHHIYIDNHSTFYNSVTGALSLFKSVFDEKGILQGLHTQYTNFYNWYFKDQNGTKDDFLEVLSLFVNYKNFRQPTGTHPEWGLMYKRLSEYNSIGELVNELKYYKEVNKIERQKNLYLNEDLKPFSKEQMKQMWVYLTNIANHYGNMVHITNERLLRKKFQNLVEDKLYLQIIHHYTEINKILSEVKELFPHSIHSFDEYIIDANISDFIDYLENQFNSIDIDYGRCVVPEKILKYKRLTGMTDVYVDINDNLFDIGDHKTNKKYTFYSEFDNFLKPPFQKMEECEHNIYTLQANIYATMIENTTGKLCRELWITYFDRKTMSYIKYKLERMKSESQYIIDYYLKWIESVKQMFYNNVNLGEFFKQTLPVRMEDHFFKNLYYDIQERKRNNELDDDEKKWIKFYKKYTLDYIDKFKYIV